MNTCNMGKRLLVYLLGGLVLWGAPPAVAHNLDQRDTAINFDEEFIQVMTERAGSGQRLVQVGDEVWLVLKSTPGPGTLTGVGGYLTFYVPTGMVEVLQAVYLTPTPGTASGDEAPANFTPIPLKGQSIISIGSGLIGSASTPALIGLTLSNAFGQVEKTVTDAGVHRGTIAGVYADTGLFFSQDPRTEWQSWSNNLPAGYPLAMVNNRGETIVPITRYDGEQLIAYGRKDVAPIVDPNGRGNAPWGLANVVAGPLSGYAWQFDLDTWLATGDMKDAVDNIGPWQRIQYPGSQYALDQAGSTSTALGYAGEDASTLGFALAPATPLPSAVNAVRFSYGMLELGRPEYAAIKVRILQPPPDECFSINTDAFGGDAGGEQAGKDHEWRYYDPTTVTLNPCTFLTKTASDPLVKPGESLSFKITFANLGTVPLTNLVLRDTLPSGLTFLSAVPAQSSGPNPLVWNIGTMPTNSITNIYVFVRAASVGTWPNTVVATSGTNFIAQAEDTVEVSFRALLRQVKTVAPVGCTEPGGTVTYTIEVLNEGTGPNGTPLTVTDYLPPGFSFGALQSATLNGAVLPLSAVGIGGTANIPTFTVNQSIQADRKLVLVFTANVSPTQPLGTYYNEVGLRFENKILSGAPTAPVEICGGKIGDTIFRDWNGNGVQDFGEEGMPGVTVSLYYDADDDGTFETFIGTATTDANGFYLFNGLSDGDYRVEVPAPGTGGVPAAYILTADPDGSPATFTYDVPLAPNEEFFGADWGYQPAGNGVIGDQVFEDQNGDGIFNGADAGIANVTVWLYEDTNGNGVKDSGDLLVATTTTGVNGIYSFTGLAEGLSYLVDVDETSAGLAAYFSPNTFVATTPALQPVPSLSGTYNDADFGYIANLPSSIGDQVFIDKNGDGIYTLGTDLPLPGITVTLYRDSNADGKADGPALTNVVSDVSGLYTFTNLPPDTYLVVVDGNDPDLPGGLAPVVSQYVVPLATNTSYLTADFPFQQLINKTVDKSTASPSDTLTFTITPFYPGSGGLTNVTVTDLVPTGTTFASAGQGGVNSPPGTVTWSLGSTTAASNGFKTISGGTTATIAQRGSATTTYQTANNSSVSVAKPTGVVSGDVMIANFSLRGGNSFPTASGWTTIDTESIEPGTGGQYHRVALLYRVADGTEGANITFNFAATVPTEVTVAIVAYSGVSTTGGYLVGGGSGGPFDCAPGSWNYSASSPATATSITTESANALVAMFVGGFDDRGTVSGFTTTSPGALNSGSYSYNNNRGTVGAGWKVKSSAGATGNGTATLSSSGKNGAILIALKPGTDDSFSYDTITSLSANQSLVTSNDTITVTLTVTATGSGLPVTVTAGALTATGTSGSSATFGAASPLSQSVSSGVPATFTYTSTSVTAGSTPGVLTFTATPSDSNGNWAQGTANTVLVTPPLTFTATVNNPPGVNVVTNQALLNTNGFLVAASPITYTALSASIGDFVWADLNGDGVQDVGEPGIAGVTMWLYLDLNDNGIVDPGESLVETAVTDGAGAYLFFNVVPGTNYVVTYDYTTVPAGYLPTSDGDADAGKTQHDVGPISATTQYTDADFGLQPPDNASIGDTVWVDSNANGVVDVGEMPLTNITVNLYYDANMNGIFDWGDFYLWSTMTDSNGNYLFTGLNPNSYLVEVDESSLVTSPYDGASAISNALALVSGANPAPVTITSPAQAYLDADFGYNWTGAIGDYVWWDDNRDGLQNEPVTNAIPGAFVMLFYDANSNGVLDVINGDIEIAYAITDANGNYLIENLPPGPYLADVYEDSIELDGPVPTTPNVQYVNLGAGQTNLTADFGYYRGAKVEGRVFWDENRNAFFDFGELGLTNVAVVLTGTDMSGASIVLTNYTDAAGNFFFVVPEGDYTLTYDMASLLANYPLLSDVTTTTSFSFHAYPGESWVHEPFDFGVDNSGQVGGRLFGDIDSDGMQDPGEPNFAGVTVALYIDNNNDNVVDAGDTYVGVAVTDATGNYLFEGLPDGDYVVQVNVNTLPGGYLTTTTAGPPTEWTLSASEAGATVSGGGAVLDRDFGYPPEPGPTYTVSGKVWEDFGPGAFMTNAVIDPGEWGFTNVAVVINVDTNSDGMNDLVYTVFTDANGDYSLSGIPSNSTVTIAVQEGTLPSPVYEITPGMTNVLTIANIGADAPSQDFGYYANYGAISGTIVTDGDGDGLAQMGETVVSNVTVVLRWAGPDGILNTADDVLSYAVTDANGDYSFTNLPPGQYEVTKVNPAGYNSLADADGNNPASISVSLANGQTVVDRDFELYRPVTIGDFTWVDSNGNGQQDPGEPGLPNVVVTLYDATSNVVGVTTSDMNGAYAFADLFYGTYFVAFDPPAGYWFTLANMGPEALDSDPLSGTNRTANITLVPGETNNDVDAGFYELVAIGDYTWVDSNGNGLQDVGEPALSNVVVTLYDASSNVIGVTTSDVAGAYAFVGLPPGTYSLQFSPPAGYQATLQNQGGDDALDSDVDPTGLTGNFAVTSGEDASNWDAGFFSPALEVYKTAGVATYDAAGDVITYAFTVTNSGNVTITNILVTDPRAPVSGGPIDLAPGASDSTTFTASYTIQQADVDAGSFTNTATAKGQDPNGKDVTDSDEETVDAAQDASIAVAKAADPAGQTYDAVGDVITYQLTLSNDGNVTVYNPAMADPQASAGPTYVSGDADSDGVLDVGETWVYSASYTIRQADLDRGSFTNAATGTGSADTDGDGTGDEPVTDSDEETVEAVQRANIEIVKTADPTTYDAVGDEILYTFIVKNIGNVTLTNVMVGDPLFGLTFGPISLVPAASQTFSNTYTITAVDLAAGSFTNVAKASGQGPDGATVEDEDDASVCRNLFMTPPPDLTLECTDDISTNSTGIATAVSGCGCLITISHEDAFEPGDCPQNYVLLRVWTASDDCANLIIHTQLITVVDTQAPVFNEELPVDTSAECDEIPDAVKLTARDNCDTNVTVVYKETQEATIQRMSARGNGNCPENYVLVRTWTATDDCGNQIVHTQRVAVVDTTAPVLAGVPADDTIECDAVPEPPEVTATDNCDTNVAVVYAEATTPGDCANRYTLVRTWTAADDCGNATAATQTITVVDTQAPVFNEELPVDTSAECDEIPDAVKLTARDNCDTNVTVVYKETQEATIQRMSARGNGNCPENYVLVRTWTATDDCGNQVVHTQRVAVVDTTAPVLAGVPADDAVECDAVPEPPEVTASDNCDTNVAVVYAEATTPGDCANRYTLVRTWTAADDCGNATAATQTITVVDTQAPVITVPVDVTIDCLDSTAPSNTGYATALDACDLRPDVTFVDVSSGGNPEVITRTWTATDDCDNSSSGTQTITILCATIGDLVWNDVNGNGLLDPGEAGIAGVAVSLLGTNGNVIATMPTDANGAYNFGGLAAGDYVVDVDETTLPLGSVLTGGTDPTGVISLLSGAVYNDADFGYQAQGTLTGVVYNDVNGNGTQDAGEPGLPGVVVVVTDSQGNVTTNITDASGAYSLTVPAGDATVDVDETTLPAGSVQTGGTDPTTVTVPAGGTGTDADGYQAQGTLTGVVYNDVNGNGTQDAGEPGLPGVVVVVTDSQGNVTTNVTDASGAYSLTVPAGSVQTGGTDPTTVTVPAGGTGTDADGYFQSVSIGDFVWDDLNGNGIQEIGEPGVPGVSVNLYDSAMNLLATVVTDANGFYLFTNVTPASGYVLGIVPPAGYAITLQDRGADDSRDSDIHPVTGLSGAFVMTSGATNLTVDAGLYRPAAVGNFVWLDENWDGFQDPGEQGIPNVRIELLDGTGTIIGNTITDLNGFYLFSGLPPGMYTVRVDAASLASQLAANPTFDLDGTVDQQTTVFLVSGTTFLLADFGYNWSPPDSAKGAIGDRIWGDADADGIQDPGEPGIPNVTVGLFADLAGTGNYTSLVATATTDATGLYIFPGLSAGAYVVAVNPATLPPGYLQTADPDYFGQPVPAGTGDNRTTAPIILAPGDVFVNTDFGYSFPTGSDFGDVVYFDANADRTNNPADGDFGIPGVTVVLLDGLEQVVASTITDANGQYLFTGLPAGTYTVWINDSANLLSGLVQTGDPDGGFDGRSTVILDGVNSNLDQDHGYAVDRHTPETGLIGDVVFLDRNGDGIPGSDEGLQGVVVRLYDASGTVLLATTITDANGQYFFGGLPPGSYVVRVDPATLPAGGADLFNSVYPVGGSANEALVMVAAGEINLDQDFGYATEVPNSIGGTLWLDANANGILDPDESIGFAEVTLVLRDAADNLVGSTVTDANGNYVFTGLPDGAYRVDVVDSANVLLGYWHSLGPNPGMDGNSQVDPYQIMLGGGQADRTADFGYHVASAQLGDFVWHDKNTNGLQDSESGISNVLVRLEIEYPNGTSLTMWALTDNAGYYWFKNLLLYEQYSATTTNNPVGGNSPRFQVSVPSNQPALLVKGFMPTILNAGVGTNDSRNAQGVYVPLSKGEISLVYDFGYQGKPLLAVIGGIAAFTRDGQTIVQWETIESWDTAGFWLERKVGDEWVRISPELLPFPIFGTAPIVYEEVDPGAMAGETYQYRLVEMENDGDILFYGPYELTVDGPGFTYADWAAANFAPEELADPAISGTNADPDGDGLTNWQEFLAGTDPINGNSVLQITSVRRVAGGVEFRWDSVAGRTYRIAVADSLSGPFLPLEETILATDGNGRAVLSTDFGEQQMFFRVILVR